MMLSRWVIPLLIWQVGAGAALAQPLTVGGDGSDAVSLTPPQGDAYDTYGEELLRGPVHEAYAEQYNQEPVEGVIIDREPPPLVPEIPPEQKLAGDNVEWLPGYWFWDDERQDFIWISGVWRKIPPGQRWLPGYWAESDGSYQWVSGTWVVTDQEEIEYIAQSPPETLELGPVGEPPSTEHFWIPGCWIWQQNNYAWRPGYWSIGYSNWVWVPHRYLWTPSGYVFLPGYWDYPFVSRGTLFAPFYFSQPVYVSTGFYYTPRLSLLASALQAHFWVRPNCRHYYFGDFYGVNYSQFGLYPWHTFHRGIGGRRGPWGYDPLFAFNTRNYRARGINYFQQVNNQFNIYINQSDRRPPRTYREQLSRERAGGGPRLDGDRGRRGDSSWDGYRMAESFREVAERDRSRYTRVPDEARQRWRSNVSDTASLAALRREAELRGRQNRGPREDGARDGNAPSGRERPTGDRELTENRLRLPPSTQGRGPDRSRDDRAEGPRRGDRPGRSDGPGRGDGPGLADRPSRGDGPDRSDRPGRGGAPNLADGPGRGDAADRNDRPGRGDGPPRGDGPGRGEGPAVDARPGRGGDAGQSPDRAGPRDRDLGPIIRDAAPGSSNRPSLRPERGSGQNVAPGAVRPEGASRDGAPATNEGAGTPGTRPRPGGSSGERPPFSRPDGLPSLQDRGGQSALPGLTPDRRPTVRPQPTNPPSSSGSRGSSGPSGTSGRPEINLPRPSGNAGNQLGRPGESSGRLGSGSPLTPPSSGPGRVLSRPTPPSSAGPTERVQRPALPDVSRPNVSPPQRSAPPSGSRPSLGTQRSAVPNLSRPGGESRPSFSPPQRTAPQLSPSRPQPSPGRPQFSPGRSGRPEAEAGGSGRSAGPGRAMPSLSPSAGASRAMPSLSRPSRGGGEGAPGRPGRGGRGGGEEGGRRP